MDKLAIRYQDFKDYRLLLYGSCNKINDKIINSLHTVFGSLYVGEYVYNLANKNTDIQSSAARKGIK